MAEKSEAEKHFIASRQSTGETYTFFDSLNLESVTTTTTQHQPNCNEEIEEGDDGNSARSHDDKARNNSERKTTSESVFDTSSNSKNTQQREQKQDEHIFSKNHEVENLQGLESRTLRKTTKSRKGNNNIIMFRTLLLITQ